MGLAINKYNHREPLLITAFILFLISNCIFFILPQQINIYIMYLPFGIMAMSYALFSSIGWYFFFKTDIQNKFLIIL